MARVVETSFLQLEAPVRRVTAFDIVYPGFARERGWLPGPDRVLRAVRETLAF
jgi:pyruvate dehydrogenase E1 component beta subunit